VLSCSRIAPLGLTTKSGTDEGTSIYYVTDEGEGGSTNLLRLVTGKRRGVY